jgi:hypothetical protein
LNKLLLVVSVVFFVPTILAGQDSVSQGFEHRSADSLKQLEQTLKTEAGSDARPYVHASLADFPNDLFMVSVREADGVVEWHETSRRVLCRVRLGKDGCLFYALIYRAHDRA